MEFLYELESQAAEFIVERMRRTISDALSNYKPMFQECDVAVARRHCYERTLITKYGEMRLDVPVFRRGDCGAMRGGLDVIGKGQTHLRTGETRYRATSLLERSNREIRAHERMGSVWTVHNLLALSRLRGVLT